jgi:prolyl-tRNA synthetase
MKDSYSIDADADGLDHSYRLHHEAYERVFRRLGLDTIAVSSDVGIMGGSGAHEFMVLNPQGEDTLVLCDACGYAANQQIAPLAAPANEVEEVAEVEEVDTPGTETIAALAEYLDIPTSRTAKAAFFVTGDGRLVTAIVRGDFDVNETKLTNAVRATGGMRPAQADEIRAAGMEPGYGSPIGSRDTAVVVDALAAASPNLVAGANRPGVHLRNVNVGRDFPADVVADIANVREGDPCPQCGAATRLAQGIEVGNIFKLGTDFTEALGATYLAEDGSRRHPVMGSYGIGLGRVMACIVEAHHDEKGMAWPAEVAPFAVHLVAIGAGRDAAVADAAETLYQRLTDAGVATLYDDRDESPGVKLTDAELLGMPTIVTISPRSLAAGGAEVTDRASGNRGIRPIDELVADRLAG